MSAMALRAIERVEQRLPDQWFLLRTISAPGSLTVETRSLNEHDRVSACTSHVPQPLYQFCSRSCMLATRTLRRIAGVHEEILLAL